MTDWPGTLESGGDEWPGTPEASPNVAADVAKSAGIGLARGAIGIPGGPGDIQSLVRQGLGAGTHWLAENYPSTVTKVADVVGRTFPQRFNLSSADIQRGAEAVTGPWYDPKTTPGRYAESIASFAPALFGDEASIPTRIARTVAGGTASEAAGEATQGTVWEPYARLAAGAAGLGAGHLVGDRLAPMREAPPSAPPPPPPSRFSPDMRSLERDVTGVEPPPEAVATPRPNTNVRLLPPEVPHDLALNGRTSAGAAAADVDPLAGYSEATIAKAREFLAENGLNNPHMLEQTIDEVSPHHTLAEFSPGLEQRLGQTAAADRGTARNLIAQTFDQRGREAPDRMSATFDRLLGRSQNRVDWRQAIEDERARQSQPFWNAFADTRISPTPEIDDLMPRLQAAGVIQAANKKMAIQGVPASELFGDRSSPTARTWDYVRRAIDDEIKRNLEHGSPDDVRIYTQLKNDVLRAIDNHPDPNVAGLWRDARRTWQVPSEILDAEKTGYDLLTGNVKRDNLATLTEGWSPEQRQAGELGVRNRLRDLELSNRSPTRVSTRIMNDILKGDSLEKLRGFLGDERASQIEGALRHEEAMHGAPDRIYKGSQTAGRLAGENPFAAAAAWLDQVSVENLLHGSIGPVIRRAATKIGLEKWARKQEEAAAKFREEYARMMTTQGPERDALARALAGSEEPSGGGWSLARREISAIGRNYEPEGQRSASSAPPDERGNAAQRGEVSDDANRASAAGVQSSDLRGNASGAGGGEGPRAVREGNPAADQRGAGADQATVGIAENPTGDRQPLTRTVLARGRSGRPIKSAPLPIGNENAILERGLSRVNESRNTPGEEPSPSINAYHGSPHDFDKFDLSKIGTGEGAQAYGHGLYFAEHKGVADSYRESLTPSPDTPDFFAKSALEQYSGDRVGAAKSLRTRARFAGEEDGKPYLDAAEIIESGRTPVIPTGRLYQVSIKADPEHFLDWDRPLSEQSEHVQSILREYAPRAVTNEEAAKLRPDMRGRLEAPYYVVDKSGHIAGYADETMAKKAADLAGGEIGNYVGGPEVTQKLSAAGIPGIRYLDRGSRAAGEGSRNYVVFDDKLIDILKKYGIAGLIAGGAYHFKDSDLPPNQRARGGRIPGELPPSQKHSHEEVGYVSTSPRSKQRCALCTKFIPPVEGGPACKKVESPIAAKAWCRRFIRKV